MASANTSVTLAAIINNFNYAAFVGEAVRSVLDQIEPFDEVVVVDDGSSDNSLEVLRSFGSDIRVIEKTNGGQLEAVFAAVAECTSTYVYVLDADDMAEPELVREVKRHIDGDTVKLQFQLQAIERDGTFIDSVFPSYPAGYDSAKMTADNETLGFYVCPPTSGNVFLRSYLDDLASENLTQREAFDGVPVQLAPYFGAVASLNSVLARYRVHDDSDSQWGSPTPELLRGEIERYQRRWNEAGGVLSARGMPRPQATRSAFVAERQLMIQVLESQRPPARLAFEFARLVSGSSMVLAQRVSLVLWAFALALLPLRTSTGLVLSRRSARQRGKLVSLIARLVRA